jgi:hypothetical protein
MPGVFAGARRSQSGLDGAIWRMPGVFAGARRSQSGLDGA